MESDSGTAAMTLTSSTSQPVTSYSWLGCGGGLLMVAWHTCNLCMAIMPCLLVAPPDYIHRSLRSRSQGLRLTDGSQAPSMQLHNQVLTLSSSSPPRNETEETKDAKPHILNISTLTLTVDHIFESARGGRQAHTFIRALDLD